MTTIQAHGSYNFGTFKGCLAFEHSYRNITFVFTGISAKRYTGESNNYPKKAILGSKREFNPKRYRHMKLQFVSNKQLMDITTPYYEWIGVVEAREFVNDGKRGTSYESYGCSGGYFHCLRPKSGTPTPNLRRK